MTNETFPNRKPAEFPAEREAANDHGVIPLRVIPTDPKFIDLINSSGSIKWAVDLSGTLWAMPALLDDGFDPKHPVLVGGRDVLAAGEAELKVDGSIVHLVSVTLIDINNHSGHYWPSVSSLRIGIEAFEVSGVIVPDRIKNKK